MQNSWNSSSYSWKQKLTRKPIPWTITTNRNVSASAAIVVAASIIEGTTYVGSWRQMLPHYLLGGNHAHGNDSVQGQLWTKRENCIFGNQEKQSTKKIYENFKHNLASSTLWPLLSLLDKTDKDPYKMAFIDSAYIKFQTKHQQPHSHGIPNKSFKIKTTKERLKLNKLPTAAQHVGILWSLKCNSLISVSTLVNSWCTTLLQPHNGNVSVYVPDNAIHHIAKEQTIKALKWCHVSPFAATWWGIYFNYHNNERTHLKP